MALIILIENASGQKKVPLSDKPIIIGRSSSCDCTVDDIQISGKHCAFKATRSSRVLVKDLGTTNGTFLNESLVTDTNIMIGDIIRIGETYIKLVAEEMSGIERKALTKEDGQTKVRYMSMKSERKDKVEKPVSKAVAKKNSKLELTQSRRAIRHSKKLKPIPKKKSIIDRIHDLFNIFKKED